jgi:hypothetical protein
VSFDHLVVSLGQLHSFNHSQCDAILQARQIEVVNAYSPRKSGFERDTVYSGLYWIVGWLLVVLIGLAFSWRSKDPNRRTARLVLPFFVLAGLGGLCVQLQAMAEYADTCQRVLRSSQPPPPASELVHPAIAGLIVVAVAGAWFGILFVKYRETADLPVRLFYVAMMFIGAAFLGSVLLSLFR